MTSEPEICGTCRGRGTVPMGSQNVQCGTCYGTCTAWKRGTYPSHPQLARIDPDWPLFQIMIIPWKEEGP